MQNESDIAGGEQSGAMDWGELGNSVGCMARLLRNELTVRVSQSLDPFELHSGAHTTMWLISANPGCAQTELAQEMAVTKSALVAILDQLEEQGLAKRVRSKGDRRRNGLYLTEKGEEAKLAMFAQTSEVERVMHEELGPDDMQTMLALMRRAYSALTSTARPAGT